MANTRGKRKDSAPVDEAMEKVDTTIKPTKSTIVPGEGARANAEGHATGTVICDKLNVRKAPTKGSTVLKIISKDTKVKILDSANDVWYKVCVDNIGTGFCMKEFIKVGK